MPEPGHASSSRVRVLWLVKCLGLGGTEQLLLGAARVHDHRRVSITCGYIVKDDPTFVDALAGTGVRPEWLGRHGTRVGWVPALLRLLASGEFDVVHIHSPLLGSIARLMLWLLPRSRRPAVVTTEHNVWDDFHRVTRWLNRTTIGWDDLIVAVSEGVRQSMSSPIRERCEVVIHGVDLEAFSPQRRRRAEHVCYSAVDGPYSLLTVANLRHSKDYPNLLHALARLRDWGVPFRAQIVGGGPLETSIRSLMADLDLSESVKLLGVRDDVPDLMAAADLLVISSILEGLPVVMMESLAIGLPIVSTAVGGLPEVLDGTGAAVLVPARSPERLADAIQDVLRDNSRLAVMSTSASELAQNFDIRCSAGWFEDCYASLVAREQRKPVRRARL